MRDSLKWKRLLIILELLAVIGLVTFAFYFRLNLNKPTHVLNVLAIFTVCYLLYKPILASWYAVKKVTAISDELSIAVVIPFFNEQLVVFKDCLESILNQTVPNLTIYLIDDGSISDQCYQYARKRLANRENTFIKRFEKNAGKRVAQAWAFEQITEDIVATIDSDTVLNYDAISCALKEFSNKQVYAVCGNIRAKNRKRNLLTMLIDMRYVGAFTIERAAYSVFGSVLCATGVFSLYRRDVLIENLHDYKNQFFLGKKINSGDDRRLTGYALKKGAVCFAKHSLAETIVPHELVGFIKQQTRWNRSFLREIALLLVNHRPNKVYWFLALSEFFIWFTFIALILSGLFRSEHNLLRFTSIYFFGYLFVIAYSQNLAAAKENPFLFLLSPLFSLLHLCLLLPVRLYSLLTIKNTSWLTRTKT
jgi:hyaluronan synthase